MTKPGLKNMGIGAAWALGGAAVTLATYSAASAGGTYMLAYGAIAIGGVQFVYGLYQYAKDQSRSPEDKADDRTVTGLRAMYQAMIGVATADGVLEEPEVAAIAEIFTQLTGSELATTKVRDAAAQMRIANHDLIGTLQSMDRQIDPEMKILIVKACVMVAAADGAIADQEFELICQIGGALGLARPDAIKIITEMLAGAIGQD